MNDGPFDGENPPEDGDEEEEIVDDDHEETPDEPPPPATWAGRQQWSGRPDEGDEGEEPEEAEEGEVETGLTEEFDPLEQEIADEEEAADEEAELAAATADEGAEPADEFEFSDDEEPEAEADEEDADEPEAEEADEPDAEESDEPDAEESDDTDAEESAAPAAAAGGAAAAAGSTSETDTLAAADQEEAQEAALQGLRDRTAEHAKKRGVTDPGKAPEPAAAEAAEGEDADEADEPDAEPAEAATAVAATATPPTAATGDEDASAADQKPPRAGLWPRFMAATLLIVASVAAATAVSVLVYLTGIAKGLGGLPGIQEQLDEVGDQKAQTFLIIGSDVRPDQSSKGLSDTTMLLRVDPDNAITQLSIPRDLRVNIPGHGIDKFNAAYAYGGPTLTTEVVKQLTDNRIPINHVVNVDFNGFADAVDAIGCVYVDVDQHYFNDNSTAASFSDQYAEIDIQAGYQRLCGYKALQYVRFRHEDNDIVRGARQQGFLREARQKVPPSKLLDERDKLIDIFTKYTASDINDSGTLVGLFKLMIDAREAQITQIEFPFDSLDDEGYVTAGDAPLQDAVSKFLGEKPVGEPPPPEPKKPPDGGGKPDKKPEPKPEPKPREDKPDSAQTPEQIAASQMIDATGAAQAQAAAIIEEGGKNLKFPVLYPTRIMPSGNATVSDDSRYFGIDGGNGKLYHGYKFVMTMQGSTYPVAYYGVSGTDWLDAPLFENPSDKRKIGDREYSFYRDGGQLRMLAFERDKTMYWVTNTLDKLLTEPQMIAIAQNLREVGS